MMGRRLKSAWQPQWIAYARRGDVSVEMTIRQHATDRFTVFASKSSLFYGKASATTLRGAQHRARKIARRLLAGELP